MIIYRIQYLFSLLHDETNLRENRFNKYKDNPTLFITYKICYNIMKINGNNKIYFMILLFIFSSYHNNNNSINQLTKYNNLINLHKIIIYLIVVYTYNTQENK